MKTYYDILNVRPDATEPEIKSAWRKKMHECAPDKRIGEDDTVFKQVEEAYKVLGNREKRKEYDLSLRSGSVKPKTAYVPPKGQGKGIKSSVPNEYIDPSRIIHVGGGDIGKFRIF